MAPTSVASAPWPMGTLYNRGMKWIIPDALPPAALSQSLGQALVSADPQLPALFDRYLAHSEPSPVHQHGCTPAERLMVESLGWKRHHPDLPAGSALAALHAGLTDASEPVWMAQICSTMITAERAVLLTLPHLQMTPGDFEALQAAATDLMSSNSDGITFEPVTAGNWIVKGPLPAPAWLPSPAAIQGKDVGDWWPTQSHWRAWRRLLNEIQMCWHEHAVNTDREQAGLPAINGLWLYGGGHGWVPQEPEDTHWKTDLAEPASQGDWQRWVNRYRQVIAEIRKLDPSHSIILTGEDRIVHLKPRQKTWLSRLLSRPKQSDSWNQWWNSV